MLGTRGAWQIKTYTKFDITPLCNLQIINPQKLRTDISTLQGNRNGIKDHNKYFLTGTPKLVKVKMLI